MPIRRSRVNVIATDPTTRFVVDDAEPFKVGDAVHAIDVSGPNAGCTDLGAITLIDYNTNTITVTNNASGLNVDDWIEVTENGCVDVGNKRFKHPRLIGMLKTAHDTRLTAGDTTGTTPPGTVVVNGSIRAADVNFNATPADDELLIVQFSELTPNPDRINIIIAGVPCPPGEKMEICDTRGNVLHTVDAADLRFANLYNADLYNANLRGADLYNANLSNANLYNADLYNANLRGADLTAARINWQLHALLAELLRQAAGDNVPQRSLAGLIGISTEWCWPRWAQAVADGEIAADVARWAVSVLAEYDTDANPAPADFQQMFAACKEAE